LGTAQAVHTLGSTYEQPLRASAKPCVPQTRDNCSLLKKDKIKVIIAKWNFWYFPSLPEIFIQEEKMFAEVEAGH